MKKAVFFDIDGTLLDCSNGILDITPNVKNMIRLLQKSGNYVFVATGRPYALLDENIMNFGFDGFILANGAHILINNETIYSEHIDKGFINDLVKEFEKNNIQYILQGELYSYMKKDCKEFYDYYDGLGISRKYLIEEFNLEDIDIHKVEMLCPDDYTMDLCLELAKSNTECDYFSSINKKALELYLKKNTKGSAILKAIEHLGIPIENTFAFGDGKNDIEMLSTVGCGIAMGNASDEVKKFAKEITDSVKNDGVAIGIKKFIID